MMMIGERITASVRLRFNTFAQSALRKRAAPSRCDRSKKMVDAMKFDRLEAQEVLPDGRSFERSDKDESAIGIFGALPSTVDATPVITDQHSRGTPLLH